MLLQVTLYSLGGGLFPLVPRVCSLMRSMYQTNKLRYFRLRWAAQSGAISCVKWIMAHEGVDADITSSAQVQEERNEKVCLNALVGLVHGGHVDLAARLVGCEPAVCQCLGVRWPGSPGSQKDVDMRERIKGSSKLKSLLCNCVGTPVESVRWVFDWLGMREPWEFMNIIFGAIDAGNAPLVQWIVTTFNLSEVLSEMYMGISLRLAEGKCPVLLKWWIESFSVPLGVDKELLLVELVCNEHSTVELCQWVKNHLHIRGDLIKTAIVLAKNPMTMRWVIEEISVWPTASWLDHLCLNTGDLELVKWVVTDKGVQPTKSTFLAACDSKKENLELVKWLSSRVALSPTDLQVALCNALCRSNTTIADWLDSTFGVMNTVNSKRGAPYSLLSSIGMKVDSLRWFIQHVDIPQLPPERVEQIILKYWTEGSCLWFDAIFLMLDAFHISLQNNSELRRNTLRATLMHGTLKDLVIKWIVHFVGLERIKSEALYTRLVEGSVYWNKTHCFMWLIDTLDLQLNEVLVVFPKASRNQPDLYMWKRLVNRFPSIDTETVRSKCMKVIARTPAIAEWAMARFSLSWGEIATYNYYLDLETRLWRRQREPSAGC
ncbi:hypothetical protein Pelo_9308 [Pelomyxa schiedti]|nr:hypothetical protein Pelo_9308 [Pelomyxa schiedti]